MKASPDDVTRLSRRDDFVVTPYGRSVYVSQWLDGAINWRRLEALVKRSYRITVTEADKKGRTSRKGGIGRKGR